MFEEFKRNPKPIVWNNFYKPQKNESEDKALGRCYKNLLFSRILQYKKISKKTLKFSYFSKKSTTVKDIYKKNSYFAYSMASSKETERIFECPSLCKVTPYI